MEGFVEVKVVKIYREANKSVYDLTKCNLNLREDIVAFIAYFSFFLNVLLSDIRGIG